MRFLMRAFIWPSMRKRGFDSRSHRPQRKLAATKYGGVASSTLASATKLKQ